MQQRLQRQLEGQTRWLEMLKSDTELATAANCDLDTLRTRASVILAHSQTESALASCTLTKGKRGSYLVMITHSSTVSDSNSNVTPTNVTKPKNVPHPILLGNWS